MSSHCPSAPEQLLQMHRGSHQAGAPTGLCILLRHQCCAGSSGERRSLVRVKQHSVLSGYEALKQRDSEQQGCSEPQDAQQGHRRKQEAAHSSWRFLGSEYSLRSGEVDSGI